MEPPCEHGGVKPSLTMIRTGVMRFNGAAV